MPKFLIDLNKISTLSNTFWMKPGHAGYRSLWINTKMNSRYWALVCLPGLVCRSTFWCGHDLVEIQSPSQFMVSPSNVSLLFHPWQFSVSFLRGLPCNLVTMMKTDRPPGWDDWKGHWNLIFSEGAALKTQDIHMMVLTLNERSKWQLFQMFFSNSVYFGNVC